MVHADRSSRSSRGVSAAVARRLILRLPGVQEGRSYGFPAFKVAGKFFARLRDDDSVLVVNLSTIADREVLMQLDPEAFYFTEHYRNYPTVLVRLAEVERSLLAEVLEDARLHMSSVAPHRVGEARRLSQRRPPKRR